MSFINPKRLRDYPRLMFFAIWVILAINIIFRDGWMGAFGQVIGGDFIMFYSTGTIYRANPDEIYSYEIQTTTQQSLVEPTILPGYNPYMNPPFVAPIYSLFTRLSLPIAFSTWTILALLSVFLSAFWLNKLIQANIANSGLTYLQLVIIIFSSFPFIEGLLSGQNHWLSLLLVSGITVTMLYKKWYLTGFFLGLLLYKPQFVIGFIILLLIWKNYKALYSFGIVLILWVGLFIAENGMELFQEYSQVSQAYMLLPYFPGWPKYLLVTAYGFLTSVFPLRVQPALLWVVQVLLVISCIALGWLAYRLRKKSFVERSPAFFAAILLPLLATPYALLHDMIILIPAFILLSRYATSRNLLYIVTTTYMGTFFLSLLGALTDFAWVSLLTIGIAVTLITWISEQRINLSASIPQ